LSAAKIAGCCAIPHTPSNAIVTNQISITGPNSRPMRAVPCCCTANSATRITTVAGST
jgi:hypothetical protein